MTTQEPLITYNLLLCAIAFPALGFFIRKLITDTQEQAKDRYSLLYEEIKDIKRCLRDVKDELNNKVDEDVCDKRGDEKWGRINKHRHAEDGSVIIPA